MAIGTKCAISIIINHLSIVVNSFIITMLGIKRVLALLGALYVEEEFIARFPRSLIVLYELLNNLRKARQFLFEI